MQTCYDCICMYVRRCANMYVCMCRYIQNGGKAINKYVSNAFEWLARGGNDPNTDRAYFTLQTLCKG